VTCVPPGVCSWQFRLLGPKLRAETRLDVVTETGSVTIGNEHFAVHKDGMLSGHWALGTLPTTVYTAQKLTPFQRTVQLEGPHPAELRATSVFARAMELRSGDHRATMAPAHAHTRRATIVGTWPDDRLVVFAFWLCTVLWRRAGTDHG
jgi:hypothetical protein